MTASMTAARADAPRVAGRCDSVGSPRPQPFMRNGMEKSPSYLAIIPIDDRVFRKRPQDSSLRGRCGASVSPTCAGNFVAHRWGWVAQRRRDQ